MGFAEIDPQKKNSRQGVEPRGEAVSSGTDYFLIIEEVFGLQYIMWLFFIIALPVLSFFTVYNILASRYIEAILVGSAGCLFLFSYFAIGKSRHKFFAATKQYWIFQNVIRAFLLLFLIYISYATGWKSELDRLQWSYLFPIVAFLCLGRKEGFYWVVFFIASLVLILFYPRPEALSPDAFLGFKFRYLMSFSILCTIGIAWQYGIDVVYTRLIHRQNQLVESEKQYRDAYADLHAEMAQRRQAQQSLAESESKYRFMTDHIADIIWTVDMNLNFTYISPSIQRVLGLTIEETMSKKIYEVLTPASLQYALEAMEEESKALIRNPDRIRDKLTMEWEAYCKDGSTIWTENELKYLPGQDGKPIGIIGITRDISARKKAEVEKQNMEERLQRAEKMEVLGTLAGGVAHDLNNVLGVIVGYSELLLNEVDERSSIRPRLTKIMDGSEKAAAIVQDLLTMARRGISGRTVLNLNKLILDYQKSPELEKLSSYHTDVQIKLDLEPDLLNISGSSVHLGKALFNLVANAVEAMPKGGEINIKTANQYLDKPIYGYDEVREGDYVVLSVSDTGQGIPAKDMQRIFEPFYTKKVMGRSGTGLGLAVVWGTVKDHQSYINVQSEEGNGSTFTLYFPVTREDISVKAVSLSISEYMGKGETILVVDDVSEQRDLAEEMLKKLNYKVSSVASGEEAIAYIKENKVDLLVLDMIMDPGMDGLDTYRIVLTIQPRQKAIIVSGFSESDRVNEAHALGAGAYLKKPYVLEKLGLAVRKEFDRSA